MKELKNGQANIIYFNTCRNYTVEQEEKAQREIKTEKERKIKSESDI